MKLAFIVSHPIQYYVPLYRELARNPELEIKVFYTWHGGGAATLDRGFQRTVAWDIPLTEGYTFEVIPNQARRPGTHHFFGLRNAGLVRSVQDWRPDVVHLTGYAYASHLGALRAFHQRKIPVLFRGDSHLLDGRSGWAWWVKSCLLRTVFSWPAACLYVGRHNREYYRSFGVPEARLHFCPHSVEVARFAEPNDVLEHQAREWRRELAVPEDRIVLLYAAKFEDKKRPVALMRAVQALPKDRFILVMVGDGVLGDEVRRVAAEAPERFRVLPFQNQSRMPVVYRLGDLLVLPSAYGETWGLAVNEAMASGRPALISDRVGCGPELVTADVTGDIFRFDNWADFRLRLTQLTGEAGQLRSMGRAARARAGENDIHKTAASLIDAVRSLGEKSDHTAERVDMG